MLDKNVLSDLRAKFGTHRLELVSKDPNENGKTIAAVDDGAQLLSTLKKDFDEAGVILVGVGCSREDASKFVQNSFFDGPIYLDENKIVHKVFGCRMENWLGFIKPAVWLSFAKAMLKGLKLKKTEGDYKQLGGTFVLDTSNPKAPFLFQHRQQRWGDHPLPKSVRDAALRTKEKGYQVYSADDWTMRATRKSSTNVGISGQYFKYFFVVMLAVFIRFILKAKENI